MPTNFDFNLFDEIIKEAPTAGFGPSTTFGKCVLDKIQLVHWDNTAKKFVARDWTGSEKAEKGEYFQLTFKIDLSEFNSALTYEWTRRADVKHSGRKSNGDKDPKNLTDWDETIEPSLIAAIGKDWSKRMMTKGVYLEVEDVETVELDKNGVLRSYVKKDRETKEPVIDSEGKEVRVTNTAVKFLRSFKSKAECQAAREEKYGSKDEEASVPASFVKDFKGLVESLGLEGAITVVDEQKPFGEYSAAEVASAAGYNPL